MFQYENFAVLKFLELKNLLKLAIKNASGYFVKIFSVLFPRIMRQKNFV